MIPCSVFVDAQPSDREKIKLVKAYGYEPLPNKRNSFDRAKKAPYTAVVLSTIFLISAFDSWFSIIREIKFSFPATGKYRYTSAPDPTTPNGSTDAFHAPEVHDANSIPTLTIHAPCVQPRYLRLINAHLP